MVLLSLALGSRVNQIKHSSETDALTELPNRRHFNEQFKQAFEDSRQHGLALSLLVIDIDHFKQYNDNHGHAAGDLAIQAVARTLRRNLRKPNLPCRYGGDEFTVILPATDKPQAWVLAERLRDKIEHDTSTPHGFTITIGLASLGDGAFATQQSFFDAADVAL